MKPRSHRTGLHYRCCITGMEKSVKHFAGTLAEFARLSLLGEATAELLAQPG
jgi:hypothetical protein